MQVLARVVSSVSLSVSVGLASPVAAAAQAPAGAEQEYRDLEHRTKLDLDREWLAYGQERSTRPFADYVQARYVKRRDIGRGLVVGGAGVGLLGTALFFLGFPRNDAPGKGMVIASYACFGVMGGAVIVGAVMWSRNFRRLERLEAVTLALGPRGRVRLSAAGPIALPRGAGFGVGLTF